VLGDLGKVGKVETGTKFVMQDCDRDGNRIPVPKSRSLDTAEDRKQWGELVAAESSWTMYSLYT